MSEPLPTANTDGPVFQAARRLHAVAVEHKVQGTMQIRDEIHTLPLTLNEVAAAIRARVAECGQSAVDPLVQSALAHIANLVQTAANASKAIGPQFDDIHRVEIRRNLRPRQGEQKWDVAANGQS
jgi:hypothetical protein